MMIVRRLDKSILGKRPIDGEDSLHYVGRAWPTMVKPGSNLCGRVFELWKDISDHICQLGNDVVHNLQLDAEKNENLGREIHFLPYFKHYKGKTDFIMGGKLKVLKSHLWPEKCTNTGLEYTKSCGISTFFLGGWG